MSTNSFKRFTVKARQSFSGLRPFLEGNVSANEMRDSPFSDDKENEGPDLEEFGYNKTYTSSTASDINCSPSAKDSPSRRKRLLGTLRSMSSLRSLRSPSSKEKPMQRVECEFEPESPRTPTRVPQIRPSLTLNFEQSPPDKPMFDISPRRRSVSSSLVVHHSSPVPIPSKSQQDIQSRTMITPPCELPAGTVPKSPTPIQLILNKDPNKAAAVPSSIPVRPQMREVMEPLPTPMPGTNVGFSKDDLTGDASSSKQNVMSFREGSSYFEFPVCGSSNDAEDNELRHDAQRLAGIAARQDSFTIGPMPDEGVMVFAALDEVERARLQRKRTLPKIERVDKSKSNSHCVQHLCPPESLADGTVNTKDPETRVDPAEHCSSPIDIEHIVFEDCPEFPDVYAQSMHDAAARAQAAGQLELQKQAQLQRESECQESIAGDGQPQPTLNAWGTQGSLYDGTGYGGSSSSDSPRPSTSYTASKSVRDVSGSTLYRVDSLAEDSAAMARDHETLEEVIRAYAAFEDEGASGISEGTVGDMVAEAQADVELADTMADYSLGA